MRRLVEPGRIEIVLAVLLAVLTITLDAATGRPWPPLALDLVACAVAATTGRWPRASGAALGAVLAVYLFIPAGWATMGEYALLIPILGSGMRDATRLRLIESIAYLVILFGLAIQNAPSLLSATLGALFYATFMGVLWLIGNAFVTVTRAQREALLAETLLQRQRTALELHDTVARSLTALVMATERVQLHGEATEEDLSFVSRTATESIGYLRDIIEVLRSPDDTREVAPPARAFREVLSSAETELARHGFQPTVNVAGDLDGIPPATAQLLAAAAEEALSNVIKHGDQHGPCTVSAEVGKGEVVLKIANNCRTVRFDREGRVPMGLWGMRQRIGAAGGQVEASRADSGWLTRVSLPLPGHAARELEATQ
ncbi:MAG: histidine kinase [Propionicimonas sp.]|uniref:sensor histidine kinase n=1 Tax=Propionicimonas sp. TaxID=1955623 RepID=UPI003D0DEC04